MHRRGVVVALLFSALAAGAAGACAWQDLRLRADAAWSLERSVAQAQVYAQTFDGKAADAQLKSFSQRRSVLERAHWWQRGVILGVLVSVLSGLAAYLFFLLHRLDEQLLDGAPGLRATMAESSVPVAVAPHGTPQPATR